MRKVYCDYCGRETEYVDSKVIYGKSYGVNWPIGRLSRPGDLRRLESAVAEQIRAEPDVKSCIVEASLVGVNTVEITARADIRVFGSTTIKQVVAS